MCGIAGYSIDDRSSIDRTLGAQALLAGIAERGADAAGYAYRESTGGVVGPRYVGSGNSYASCVTFGRIAGASAARVAGAELG